MTKTLRNILLVVLAVLAAASCNRRPLWEEDEAGARVKIKVNWSEFVEHPSGMTMMLFNENNKLIQIVTNDVDSVYVTLPEGQWKVYVFNQSTSEFGSIGFAGMEHFETAEAYVNDIVKSSWYFKSGGEEEIVAKEPENLGVAVGEFEISSDMYNQYKRYYLTKADGAPAEIEDEFTAITLYPTNVVSLLEVTAFFKGIQNLNSAHASLTGLAEGFYLTQNRPNDTEVTQLLESWTKYIDDDDPTLGYIKMKSSATTFGLPGGYEDIKDFSQRDSTLNLFTMSCMLRDLKTRLDFPFYVGNKFEVEKYEVGIGAEVTIAIRLILKLEVGYENPIDLPDVPPADGGNASGFDATVDDWEEGETIEISM